jgi:hypothetical protein
MGFYLPSMYTLLFAVLAVAAIFLSRVSVSIIALVSVIILGFAMYQHYLLFASEYSSLTMVNALIPFVPYIMMAAVVFFSTIYILFLQGPSVPAEAGEAAAPEASSGFFGSMFGNKNSSPSSRRYSPNYSKNLNNSRNSNNNDNTNSLERKYLSALDRGI